MKRFSFILAAACVLFAASCQPKEDPKAEVYTIEFTQSTQVVMAGVPVKFTDLSAGATSRAWTFQDGTPATSSDAEVTVTFQNGGVKNCALEVTFKDGSKQKEDITINVTENLAAELKVEGLTERGCAPLGKAVKFSLADVKGAPTSYEWSFPGGKPATSTEAEPSVIWEDQNNDVVVKVVVKRASDNASIELSQNLIAGNYPLWVADDRFEIDTYTFDKYPNLGSAFIWGNTDGTAIGRHDISTNPEMFVRVPGGAAGTEYGLKIMLPEQDLMAAQSNAYEFCFRDNWSNNAQIVVGQKFELSFYAKVDEGVFATSHWMNLMNNVEGWLWDNARDIKPENAWSDIYPDIDYEAALASGGAVTLWSVSLMTIKGGEDYTFFGTDWTKYSFIIDTNIPDFAPFQGIALYNTYITMGLLSTGPIYFDQIQLNLIEE